MTRMAATRDGYGQALLDMAVNQKVVVLEADLGKSTKSLHFRKAHPERTVSCGIGEQNMLLTAAGLAAPVTFHLLVHLQYLPSVHLSKCAMALHALIWQYTSVAVTVELTPGLMVLLLNQSKI